MDAKTLLGLITVGEAAVTKILELIAKLKADSGLTDDQILAEALAEDQATRDAADKFLARLK